MSETEQQLSFETYCEVIKKFSPCMNDYLYVYEFDRDIYYITERAKDRFRLADNQFGQVLKEHKKFVYPDDYDMLTEDLKKVLSGEKDGHNLGYRWIGKDGKPIWINCRGTVVKSENGKANIMIGCINEIGNKQQADNISGLLGEVSFYEYIRNISEKPSGYVLRIGIDNFKKINERKGVSVGDTVLEDVAKCIKASLEQHKDVYRLVADEFLIPQFGEYDIDEAKKLYRTIRSHVDEILEKRQYDIVYTISGGIVDMRDIDNFSPDEILKLSQFALSRAKENGRNQYHLFDNDEYLKFIHGRELQTVLRKSISDNYKGFSLNFQPIVRPENGEVFAAEALLRYRREDGEMISPAETIPMLEESGLIIPVGKWVIREAIKVCKACRERKKDFKVCVNLSYVQLLKSAVYDEIVFALEELKVHPSAMIIEVTESGNLNKSIGVVDVLKKLKKYGVMMAIDDFGSGYSNLKYISNLRPDVVKVDREFTVRALTNEFDFDLLKNVIRMVHSLGSKFIVEGIETREQLVNIMGLKPEFVQGYYYSRPVEKDKLQLDNF